MYRSTFVVLLAFSIFPTVRLAADEAPRPNFVVMIADDVSPEDHGCYGHPHIRTPYLDALAADGLRFTRAFLTISSCSPSRASILTGRYPHNTGAGELHQALPAEQVMISKVLREAGYYTAAAGKWHLGNSAKGQFDRVAEGGGPSGCGDWVNVLRERPKDKPFFLWLASFDAHRGYSRNAIEKPHGREDVIVPPFLPDEPEVRDDLALYYDEISRLDGFVGQVREELAQQGVAENTVVVYLADNGRPFPRCKTNLYDSGLQTPLLVAWPKGIEPAACERVVSSLDLVPTFAELAGVKRPESFEGESLAPLFKDPEQAVRKYAFGEHNWHDYQAHERSVRGERFLYIRNAFPEFNGSPPADAVNSPTYRVMLELSKNGDLPPEQAGPITAPRPAEEFYDCEADPHQLRNLIDDPEHAETLKHMRSVLDDWIKQTGDRVPAKPTPDKFHRWTGKRLGANG